LAVSDVVGVPVRCIDPIIDNSDAPRKHVQSQDLGFHKVRNGDYLIGNGKDIVIFWNWTQSQVIDKCASKKLCPSGDDSTAIAVQVNNSRPRLRKHLSNHASVLSCWRREF